MANAMKILIDMFKEILIDMFKEDVAYKEGNVMFWGPVTK